jgi:5-aminolevulinate synthase
MLIDEYGIYIQPVFFPTVPKGDERFRVTITPKHKAKDINNFVNALDSVWSKLDLKRSDPKESELESDLNKVSKIY